MNKLEPENLITLHLLMVKDSIFRHIISSSQHCLILLASHHLRIQQAQRTESSIKESHDKLHSFLWILFSYLFTVKAIRHCKCF